MLRSLTFIDVIVFIFVSLLSLVSLTVLWMKLPLYLPAIAGLSFALLFYIGVAWRNRIRALKNKAYIQRVKTLLMHLGTYTEIVYFSPTHKTLWTTHPNSYPNAREFMRKIFARISPTPASAELKHLIDENLAGSVVLESRKNHTNKKPQRLLARVIPAEDGLIVTLTDLTAFLEGYDDLKKDYQRLEKFLDQAPVGLIYPDTNGHILAANQTFCQWVGQTRQDVMGKCLIDFIEEPTLMDIVTLRAKEPFRVHISHIFKEGLHPLFLTRLSTAAAIAPSEDQFSTSYAHAPIPTVIASVEGKILLWNPAFRGMLGDKLAFEPNHDLVNLLHPAMRSEVLTKLRRAAENPQAITPFEIRFEGDVLHATTYIGTVPQQKKGESPRLMIQFIDISEQKRLERQFIQSQKMQAVGQLAGGVAHDFNNLLTAMIGFCDLLLQRYMPNDPAYADVMQIKQNASRAANLVRQLLAFSRQQTLQPKVINITDILTELSALLCRLIGAGIELKISHERDLWLVKVDPGQLEQVIINMAVNARDAIPQDGILTIRTNNIKISHPQRVGHDILVNGDYVVIEVIDTGVGIPPDHLEHIFEPFFTTKEIGSGTGLGLSTAYGIVKQTGGVITAESEVNVGSSFKIYLPRFYGDETSIQNKEEMRGGDLTGFGTIMLVEDEDAVRMFSARALREKGYQIIEANSGEKALELLEQVKTIDLLITDVVMPKMDGPTLSKKIYDILPGIKTIFMSGYTEDTFRNNIDKNRQIHFLQKPFTLKELASKVKEVLKTEEL